MNDLLKNYKIEKLKIMNMTRIKKNSENKTIYSIEEDANYSDKIAFINKIKDGNATYLINIISLWENERENLPRQRGDTSRINTNSKKAWIKRNDSKKLIDYEYSIGKIKGFYHRFLWDDLKFNKHEFIDEWFHNILIDLEKKEKQWFREHDIRQVKLTKLKNLIGTYGQIKGNRKINDICWNGDEDISEEDIDFLIMEYEKLAKVMDEISEEINNIYPQWIYKDEDN